MIGVEQWRSGSEEVGGSQFDSEEKGGEDLGFFKAEFLGKTTERSACFRVGIGRLSPLSRVPDTL